MVLDEKHQKVAIEIVQSNRKKKSCNKCYDRGYIGFSADKTIIPCEKCVDMDVAFEAWKVYVAGDAELKEQYKELFEEDVEADDGNNDEDESKEEKVAVKQAIAPQQAASQPKQKAATNKPQVQRRSQGRAK